MEFCLGTGSRGGTTVGLCTGGGLTRGSIFTVLTSMCCKKSWFVFIFAAEPGSPPALPKKQLLSRQ